MYREGDIVVLMVEIQIDDKLHVIKEPMEIVDRELPVCYDDDDDEERSNSLKDNIISGLPPCSAITPNEPVLSTEEPNNSLSIGDEHLDTILATESDEVIKSGVENLIPILNQFEDFSESNKKFSLIDDDSFSIDDIDYVEASPPDYELVSSEETNTFDNSVPEFETFCFNVEEISSESDFFLEDVDAFLAVEDEPTSSQFPQSYLDLEGDILLLEAFLNDDHSFDFKTKSSSTSFNSLLKETNTFDNSLPESDTLCFDMEEISSGSTNTRSDISLPEYEASYDDQSCSDEDVPEKFFSTPLFDEEIIPMKIDQHHDNVESDLMESLRTHDSSLPISSKIDSLLDEFTGKLTLLKSIPPGIDETDCDFEEDIRLIERLFNSFMEEIDLSFTSDDLMPSGIEEDDYDSKRDILILE
nr:hypothetical protein [Tanacetum cinerariifolium]